MVQGGVMPISLKSLSNVDGAECRCRSSTTSRPDTSGGAGCSTRAAGALTAGISAAVGAEKPTVNPLTLSPEGNPPASTMEPRLAVDDEEDEEDEAAGEDDEEEDIIKAN